MTPKRPGMLEPYHPAYVQARRRLQARRRRLDRLTVALGVALWLVVVYLAAGGPAWPH